MIQFIHVCLNITILYQGDAMQISNLVSQYNNSVANGEPMTGAKGVEKLVSSLNEMSKGMIFEGTVSSVRGNQVKLALSNGQQILARLAGKFSFEQGQSVFFQVKNNDGGTIEIKPYTVDGEGANLTLMDALKAAGLPVDGINLSMVNKMMEEQMPIDKTSLNQMYQLVQDNKDINVTTLVELKRLGIEFATIIPYRTAKNAEKKFEDLGTACIQDRMSQREKELVAELVREGKLNQDNYLVKDGSLEYRPTKEDKADKRKYQIFKNNYNWVLGVSKNFNPEVCVDINGKPNPGFIADLPLYHRTPVACFKNPDWFGDTEFAVWYIRIRDKKRTRTPFDGIIKVEKILVTQEEIEDGIDSTLVNQLSAYLINERNPVCYGSDLRWANHLYPIYLTEAYVKSRYLSAESFLHLF